MKKKVIGLLLILIMFSGGVVFATNPNPTWWSDAYSFFNGKGNDEYDISALDDIQNMIIFAGNMVFFAVTVILGVKYIWGGVDSKASVKDSLITLIVAAMFFYGWSTIRSLFVGGQGLIFLSNNFTTTAQGIYSTIMYIANFLAVGGIIYIGIRYMIAGAEGRAQLKAQGVPIVLGIIMVYATLTFLTFIVKFVNI